MAFMIFSAQMQKNCCDSIQSSLTSSYISTDSAIAECNTSAKGAYQNAQKRNNNYNNSIRIDHQQQKPAYGQFCLARDSNNNVTNKNYNTIINEKTPLVLATNDKFSTGQIIIPAEHLLPGYNQHEFKFENFKSSQADLDSVSLNLGIAIKNSTCLVKNVDKDGHFDNNGYTKCDQNNNGDHEDNWVSSKWILVPMFPLTLSMKVLTPCKFKNTCWTIWTFLVSIALIGGLTYISVWMVHLFGQIVGIPETIAGMTILSWGTGIPELIASIVLIKKTAQADMAICNTIGSNVIDVSFCLSVPW